jgi:hypothetical protein
MARYRRKKHKQSAMSRRPHIPLALAVPALVDANNIYQTAKGGFTAAELNNLQFEYTGTGQGVNGIDFSPLIGTYGKYVAGFVVHKIATKTGVNKTISKFTRGYVVI